MTAKTHRPASHRGRRTRRGKSGAEPGLPVGLTLYYYPRTKRLTPTLYDPELQCLVRSCLARMRTILALRNSPTVVGIVLFDERQREGFWLGEND